MDISYAKSSILPISNTVIANLIVIDLVNENSSIPFVFDTGATITVMSKSTASRFGAVKTDEVIKAGGNAGIGIESTLYVVDKISLGECLINNLKVIVVEDEVLDFGKDEEGNDIKVNGFLGWDFIQNFRWEYNVYKSSLLFEEASKSEKVTIRNMEDWNNMPLIYVEMNGQKELFGFDTGNTESVLGKRLYTSISDIDLTIDSIVGIDGVSEESVKNIESLELFVNDKKVEIKNISAVNRQVFPTDVEGVCGLLGIDIIADKSWILDYRNRFFEII